MFSKSLPFSKVSAKNIYYCGQKPGESDIAHTIILFFAEFNRRTRKRRRSPRRRKRRNPNQKKKLSRQVTQTVPVEEANGRNDLAPMFSACSPRNKSLNSRR